MTPRAQNSNDFCNAPIPSDRPKKPPSVQGRYSVAKRPLPTIVCLGVLSQKRRYHQSPTACAATETDQKLSGTPSVRQGVRQLPISTSSVERSSLPGKDEGTLTPIRSISNISSVRQYLSFWKPTPGASIARLEGPGCVGSASSCPVFVAHHLSASR